MVRRAVLRVLGLGVVLICSVACSPGASSTTTNSAGVSISPTSSPASPLILTDRDLAEILAVAVPAAIEANPDGTGEVLSIEYPIADSFGTVTGISVTFPGNETPLSQDMRTAISAAISPGSAAFVPADLTKAMFLIGTPSVEADSVVVTYEQRCGGEPGALCGSGGTFRLKQDSGNWEITEVMSAWIS